jgi:ribosomal protein S18 acetylase RimI-like enzyme
MNANAATPWQVRFRMRLTDPWSEARYALRERAEDHADRLRGQNAHSVEIVELLSEWDAIQAFRKFLRDGQELDLMLGEAGCNS